MPPSAFFSWDSYSGKSWLPGGSRAGRPSAHSPAERPAELPQRPAASAGHVDGPSWTRSPAEPLGGCRPLGYLTATSWETPITAKQPSPFWIHTTASHFKKLFFNKLVFNPAPTRTLSSDTPPRSSCLLWLSECSHCGGFNPFFFGFIFLHSTPTRTHSRAGTARPQAHTIDSVSLICFIPAVA